MDSTFFTRLLLSSFGLFMVAWQYAVELKHRKSIRIHPKSPGYYFRELISSIFMLPVLSFVFLPSLIGWAGFPLPPAAGWTGNLILLLALALWAWSQACLGRNWSGQVVIRVGHSLVKSGPFRWARHPMYGSFILLAIGLTLATANLLVAALFALHVVLTVSRAPEEERLLEKEFPEYRQYRREVPGRYFPFF